MVCDVQMYYPERLYGGFVVHLKGEICRLSCGKLGIALLGKMLHVPLLSS